MLSGGMVWAASLSMREIHNHMVKPSNASKIWSSDALAGVQELMFKIIKHGAAFNYANQIIEETCNRLVKQLIFDSSPSASSIRAYFYVSHDG
jgi:hypothetical protein